MQPSSLVGEENEDVAEENKVDVNVVDFFQNTFRCVFYLCNGAPAYALPVHIAAAEEIMKPPRYVFILIRAHS